MTHARAVFFLLLAAAPAVAARRPMNWRMRKSSAAPAAAPAAVPAAAEPAAPRGEPVRLMPGRWSPQARAALEALIAGKGSAGRAYDARRPPVAVLPWSDAAVDGDPAELSFLRLVSEARFRVDDDWWGIVPVAHGRRGARVAYEQFSSLSSATWSAQPSYHAWRKTMLQSYLGLCSGVGRKECRAYLARLWAGWREDEARDFARQVLEDEKRRVSPVEMIPGEPDDRSPLRARRGLRVVPEMRDLAVKLRAAGFDVWVVDDVPQPVLAASAVDYGIDPSRVFGIHASTGSARMGAEVLKPVPTRGGKTEALQGLVGRPADLVVGRDAADADLLSYGEGLRIVFDRDPELVRRARENGWLIQPSFAR